MNKNDEILNSVRSGLSSSLTEDGVKIPKDTDILVKIEELIKKPLEKFDAEEPIPRLYMDWHLYNPLFRKMDESLGSHLIPPGLVESEARFLRHLRDFWKRENKSD